MSLTIDRVNTEENGDQYQELSPVPNKTKFDFKENFKKSLTWEKGALTGILVLSAFLGLWNLSINGYSNDFYAASVRSMLLSWHNFFYLAFDPGAWVTVDKPPLAFMVQTIFAYGFGYSGVALLLPEALAGIGGVYLLYYMVKRAFGPSAGLLSALMLAVTPIFAVMNRDNNPDSLLVFTLILSAWAALRAAELGKMRWLLLSGALVGLAFNIKMLEAWIILPAIYGMYFLFARTKWWKRILHLALTGVVVIVVSFSWAMAVDLTPAAQRPYVDGSTNNTVLDLVFGYNGLGRVDGNERGTTTGGFNIGDLFGGGETATTQTGQQALPGGTTNPGGTAPTDDGTNGTTAPTDGNAQRQGGFGGGQAPAGGFGGGGAGGGFGGTAGITRLITPMMGGEFNWYFPLAMLGIIFLAATTWFGMGKGLEKSRRMQSVAMWGGWFLVFGLVLSFSKGIIHTYYMNVMAPAGAALAGTAIVMLWQTYKKGGWLAWLLPVGLVAATLYQAYLLTAYTSWNWWLSPVLVVVGLVAFVGLALGLVLRKQPFGNKFSLGVVIVATAALLVVPTWWSIRAVFTTITGSTPSAVPGSGGGGGFGGGNQSTQSLSLPQAWTNFVSSNLGGQLLMVGIALVIGAALVGMWFVLRGKKWFNLPIASGIILTLFLVGSTGWWLNVAQAQTTSQTTNRNGGFGGGETGSVNTALLNYLTANQDGYKNILAVSSSNEASSTIAQTGLSVMSLGGFSGSDQTLTTTAQVEALVNNKIVRFFMTGGGGGGGRGGNSVVSTYVQANCQVVNSSDYSGSSTTSSGNTNRGFGGGGQGLSGTLYKCGS